MRRAKRGESRARCTFQKLVNSDKGQLSAKTHSPIEEDTGEMKVKQLKMTVTAHLCFVCQFLGFSGSSGPSHKTY